MTELSRQDYVQYAPTRDQYASGTRIRKSSYRVALLFAWFGIVSSWWRDRVIENKERAQ